MIWDKWLSDSVLHEKVLEGAATVSQPQAKVTHCTEQRHLVIEEPLQRIGGQLHRRDILAPCPLIAPQQVIIAAILLRATRQDAAWQLADLKRLGDLLKRAKGRIVYRRLDRISPLAVPVLLEIGKERVLDGTAEDELLDIAAQELIDEATRL